MMFGIFFLVAALIAGVESVPTISAINDLSSMLMKGYNKNTLPVADFDGKFELNVEVFLVALGDIDEIEERLSTVLMFIYTWNDVSMRWNSSDHSDIQNLTMTWSKVWKPILLVINPHQEATQSHSERTSMTVGYTSDGQARLLELVTFHTTCDLDTTAFPFDIQICSIQVYISENDAYEMRVNPSWSKSGNFEKENGAWKLIGRNIVGGEKSGFVISFQLERKPLFMLVNILLPIIVLALLTPLVFLMPKSSGERVGYAITTLLAISVYMTIISDHLPQNSDPMPLVSIMIFVWYIMNSSSVFIVILNTKINHIKDKRPLPILLRKFVYLTHRIRRVERLHVSVPSEEASCLADNNDDDVEKVKVNGNDEHPTAKAEEHHHAVVTWQELSVAIDKWCFVLSYLVKILIPVIFFSLMKSKRPSPDKWS